MRASIRAVLCLILLVPGFHTLRADSLPVAPKPQISKGWKIRAGVGVMAALADMATTEHDHHQFKGHFVEADVLARPFVLAPGGIFATSFVAYSAGMSGVSLLMSRNHHKIVRELSWVPQSVQTGVNAKCAIHNATLPDRHFRMPLLGSFPVPGPPPVAPPPVTWHPGQ